MNTSALSSGRNRWIIGGAIVLILLVLISGNDCSASGTSCFNLIQLTLNGLLVGGVYSLVALGIVVVNKASGVFNFAHGFMMLLGAMIFWQVFTIPPSVGLAALLGFFAGSTMFGGLSFYVESGDHENDGLTQTRFERWSSQFSRPDFLVRLGIALVVAVAIFLLMRNLKHDILRGTIGAIVGSAAMGLLIERITIRPLLGQPVLSAIMMTLGVALVLQGLTSLFWGTQPHPLSVFVEPQQEQITLYPTGIDENGETIYTEIINVLPAKTLPNYRVNTKGLLGENLSFQRNLIWGFVIGLLSFTGFVLFFRFTGVGLAMRAVAENQVLPESVGLRVRSILAIVWGIAAAMAMIAGVIQGTGPGVGVSILVIPALAFRAFPAVLLGGLESITGALIGGLIVGVIEVLTIGLVDSAAGQEFAPFAALLIVLMIRPEGLFGQHRIDRV